MSTPLTPLSIAAAAVRIAEVLSMVSGPGLVFVIGPDAGVEPGFERLLDRVAPAASPVVHRMDRADGPLADALEKAGPGGIVFVHGAERLSGPLLAQAVSDLNAQRDPLASFEGAVLIWVPESNKDLFFRHCLDLYNWRRGVVELDEAFLSAEMRRDRTFSLQMLRECASPVLRIRDRWVPVDEEDEVLVIPDGSAEPVPLSRWVETIRLGLLVGGVGSGKSYALRQLVRTLADRRLSGVGEAPVPILIREHELWSDPRWWTMRLPDVMEGVLRTKGLDLDPGWGKGRFKKDPVLLAIDGEEGLMAIGEIAALFERLVDDAPRVQVIFAVPSFPSHLFERGWHVATLAPWSRDQASAQLARLGLNTAQIAEVESSGLDLSTPQLTGLVATFVRMAGRVPPDEMALFDWIWGHQSLPPVEHLALRILSLPLGQSAAPDQVDLSPDLTHALIVGGLIQADTDGRLRFTYGPAKGYFAARGLLREGPDRVLDTYRARQQDVRWRTTLQMAMGRLIRSGALPSGVLLAESHRHPTEKQLALDLEIALEAGLNPDAVAPLIAQAEQALANVDRANMPGYERIAPALARLKALPSRPI